MEIQRYTDRMNSELLSKISELEGGIKYIEKRIIHLQETGLDNDFALKSVSEMNTERKHMEQQLKELKNKLTKVELSPDEIATLRYIIRDTALRIKIEPPDIQWNLLMRLSREK